MRFDAYLMELGHKVGGLLCGMPNLTQREGNDCRGHRMVSGCQQRPLHGPPHFGTSADMPLSPMMISELARGCFDHTHRPIISASIEGVKLCLQVRLGAPMATM